MMNTKKRRIAWTETERNKVARETARLISNGDLDNISRLSAASIAQKYVLTPDRQRPPLTSRQKEAQLLEAIERELDGEPPPAPEATLVEALAEALTKIVVDALRSPKLRDMIQNRVLEAVGGEPEVEEEPPPPPPKAPAPPRKRVLVFGLLGVQAETVTRAFPQIEFRHLNQDDTVARLKDACKSVDVAIGMVSFLGHHHDATMKKHAEDYRRVNGTVGELRRVLSTL